MTTAADAQRITRAALRRPKAPPADQGPDDTTVAAQLDADLIRLRAQNNKPPDPLPPARPTR